MRRPKPPRVVGPYQERNQWRIVLIENRKRTNLFLATQEEALRLKSELTRELERSTLRRTADVLTEWVDTKLSEGRCNPPSIKHSAGRIRLFLGPYLERDIAELTPRRAATLYQTVITRPSQKTGRPLSAASHHLALHMSRQFFAWAITRGYVRENPFREVRSVGKANAGKPQLRIEEARRFISEALGYYEEHGNTLTIAALMALMMGLRSREVLERTARDVDDGGQLLWIDEGKTKHARRHLEVPEALRPYLVKLTEGKRPEELLFGNPQTGKPKSRQRLWATVQMLCERSGLPLVCTHSLRGLYATLAVQSGAVSHAVAATLGHGSFAMTARHYAQPSAVANASTSRVAGVLDVPQTPATPAWPVSAIEQLARLSPDSLALLLRLAEGLAEGTRPPS